MCPDMQRSEELPAPRDCPTRLVAVWLGWTLRHGTGEFVREKPRGPKEVTKNSREGMLEAAKVGSIARNERGEYDGPGG